MKNFYKKPALCDPQNSYSVFERGRLNEFNEPYCVLAAVTAEEANEFMNVDESKIKHRNKKL